MFEQFIESNLASLRARHSMQRNKAKGQAHDLGFALAYFHGNIDYCNNQSFCGYKKDLFQRFINYR